jgi:hypothetical protein
LAATASEVLGGATLTLCERTLAELLPELQSLDGRLALVLDRLAGAADPVGACLRIRRAGRQGDFLERGAVDLRCGQPAAG